MSLSVIFGFVVLIGEILGEVVSMVNKKIVVAVCVFVVMFLGSVWLLESLDVDSGSEDYGYLEVVFTPFVNVDASLHSYGYVVYVGADEQRSSYRGVLNPVFVKVGGIDVPKKYVSDLVKRPVVVGDPVIVVVSEYFPEENGILFCLGLIV